MRNILLITPLLFLSPLLTHAEVGFTVGNAFKAVQIEGEIFLSCQDPRGQFDSAFFRCTEDILGPAEYSYFTGPKNTGADTVVLHATREDGSTLQTGNFVATVTQGQDRQCRYRGHYYSSDIMDCRTGGSRYCHKYFLDQNYCE